MATSKRFAAHRTFRHYVDISKFTEMEVEHQHDTGSEIPHETEGHITMKAIDQFREEIDLDVSDIKKQALE